MALLLGLLLMAALSLLALAASSDSVLQARMAENLQHSERSAISANSALAWAEDWLLALEGDVRPPPCSAPCPPGAVIQAVNSYPLTPESSTPEWWEAHGHPDGHDPVSGEQLAQKSGAQGAPGRWIVEEVWYEGAPGDASGRPAISYYRVIARGAGSGAYAAVTESIIARPWGDAAWADAFPAGIGEPRFCNRQAPETPCGRLAWRQRQ